MREGQKKKERKKKRIKIKSQALPTSSIHTGFRKKKEKKKKKILGKEPVFKKHDLCGVRTARRALLSEETPKPGTRGHRLARSQSPAACVAMVTTKLVSIHFPKSGCA